MREQKNLFDLIIVEVPHTCTGHVVNLRLITRCVCLNIPEIYNIHSTLSRFVFVTTSYLDLWFQTRFKITVRLFIINLLLIDDNIPNLHFTWNMKLSLNRIVHWLSIMNMNNYFLPVVLNRIPYLFEEYIFKLLYL